MCAASLCDVADPVSVERAAEASYEAFGNVHVVCNNAGVAAAGGIDNISLDNWRWVLDVNLMGVLHGIRTFLPHIRAHGEGGHIVNTASMAGMNSGLGFSPYVASKFAVVGMSEGLAMQLKPLGIGVSVLCPGFVHTRISESGRNRPERYGPTHRPDPASPAGMLTAQIAELVPVRPRPVGCRSASPHRDPRGRALRVHASQRGVARRAGGAVCRHPGGDGQSGSSLVVRCQRLLPKRWLNRTHQIKGQWEYLAALSVRFYPLADAAAAVAPEGRNCQRRRPMRSAERLDLQQPASVRSRADHSRQPTRAARR